MGEERSKEMKVITIVSGDSEVHLLFVKLLKAAVEKQMAERKRDLN